MNYQPFLDMHILMSDDLLQVIRPILDVFIIMFCLFVCVTFHLWLKAKERKERY